MLLNFGCWWHVNDWSYINPRSKWGEFLERIRGVLWAGFMSFPHPINDLNLRKFVYCKNDLWFYCRDWRNKQPPTKKKCRSARVPSFICCSSTVYVIFIQNSSIFSVTRKVYLQNGWRKRSAAEGHKLPKECRRRCYKKESVSSLTTEKNQLVLRIPA